MPQVASDPVVSRLQGRLSLSSRAGSPAGEPSAAFEGLLDSASASVPSPAGSDGALDKASAKATDAPNVRQPVNGQPSEIAATLPIGEVASVQIEVNLSADVLVIAEAAEAVVAGEAPDAANDDSASPAADQPAHSAKAMDTVAAPEMKSADVASAVVAVAVPLAAPVDFSPTQPIHPPTATTPVGASNAAPATAGDTASKAPVPSVAEIGSVAPAKPQTGSDAAMAEAATKTAPKEDSQKPAELRAAGLAEAGDTRSPAPDDRKAQPVAAKTGSPAGGAHVTNGHASPEAAKPASEGAEHPDKESPRTPHQPQALEHASLTARVLQADGPPEPPATAAVPAQLNGGAPPPPFNLGAHMPAPPAIGPLAALRIDTAADNSVPVAGLAVEIVSRAQDGLRRFDIRLDPPELGRIDVRLDVDSAGKVTSRVTVERTETLDLLRRDAPQLERALQHAGLNTEGGLEFSLRDQSFANREQTPRHPPATQLIVLDDELAVEAARRGYGRLIGLGGGVDIRV